MSDVPSLLPPNSTPQERALEQATARIGAVPLPMRTLWDPDTCPVGLLPFLAWTLSVDQWRADWPESVKRQAIRDSIPIHRRKGTVASLKRAISALGFSVEFAEWWQAAGAGLDPHEFKAEVETYGLGLTLEQARQVLEIIEATKPLRSHMAEISFTALVPPAAAYVGAVPFDGAYSYTVAEVGALPVPGIPDGSLALVGSTAPYSIWQFQADIGEWFALLVYADASEDLPTDARTGAMALVGTEPALEDREAWVRTATGWEPLTPDVWATYATVGELPASAEPSQVAGVGAAEPFELHQFDDGAGAWRPRILYRDLPTSLPAAGYEGALALVGSEVALQARAPYVRTGGSWLRVGGTAVWAVADEFSPPTDPRFVVGDLCRTPDGELWRSWLVSTPAGSPVASMVVLTHPMVNTQPTLIAYVNGGEAYLNAEAKQGFTGSVSGTGAITGVSGHTQFSDSGGSGGASLTATIPGFSASTRVYQRARWRAGTGAMLFVADLRDGTNRAAVVQATKLSYVINTSNAVATDAELANLGSALPNLSSPADLIEIIDVGASASVTVLRNRAMYTMFRRAGLPQALTAGIIWGDLGASFIGPTGQVRAGIILIW